MIIPFKNSFGNAIVTNHTGPNKKQPISVYLKMYHKHGYYPVYRTICNDKIKVYRNKTLNQMQGILKRLGY